MANGEEVYVSNIKNAIRALKLRTKTPAETKAGVNLKLLKEVNEPLYDELFIQYKEALNEYKKGINEDK
jgi:protein-arginine kinase